MTCTIEQMLVVAGVAAAISVIACCLLVVWLARK